jgi:hypothetical protein
MTHELVPDLHDHFPRYGGDGDVALACAGEEFPAPFAKGALAPGPQHGVGSLDEEVAQVAAPAFPDCKTDVLAVTALPLAGT